MVALVSTVRKPRLLLAMLCALAALGTGCSRSIDQALADVTRSGEGVQHDRNGDGFIFQDDPLPRSTLVGVTDPLPVDFPADVYRPKAFDLLDDSSAEDLRRVRLRAEGATALLGEQARVAMLRQGWRQVMSRRRGDSQQVMAYVKNGRTAVLLFDRAGLGEVQVAVQWRPAGAPG